MSSNYALDSELIADWIELNALSQSDNASGFDKLRNFTSEELEIPLQRVDVALNLIKRRSEILNTDYPLDVKAVGMVRRQDWAELPYTYLLRISSGAEHPFSLSVDSNSDRVLNFEKLVVIAMKNLLGSSSQAIRFGFPSEDRPVEFPKAIEWLSKRMGIKSGEAYRRLWSGWLNLDADPISVLAVPTTISPGEEWNEISSRVVVLERIRICELLSENALRLPTASNGNLDFD